MPKTPAYCLAVAVSVYALSPNPTEAAGCQGMAPGTFKLRQDLVLPLLKSTTGSKAILIRSVAEGPDDDQKVLNIDSDGSPRNYHLLDPMGQRYALNDMYSGGVVVFDQNGNKIDIDAAPSGTGAQVKKHYYDTFKLAVAQFVRDNRIEDSKYDPRKDANYKVGDDFGNSLDPPPATSFLSATVSGIWEFLFPSEKIIPKKPRGEVSELGSNFTCLRCETGQCKACFPKGIIAADEHGALCVRTAGRYSGFLVSATSIDAMAKNPADPENSEDATCLPSNLDPEKLPGFVLPGGSLVPNGSTSGAGLGDVVVGYNPKSGRWAFGIAYDGGPAHKFGEASIAFGRTLTLGYQAGAKYPRPRAYNPILEGPPYQSDRPIPLIFFPGSAARFKMPAPAADGSYDFSPATVAKVAKQVFLEWATTQDLEKARTTFKACLEELPASAPVE